MEPYILIAESDGELSDVYCQFLRQHGYDAESASDGLDCLTKMCRRTPVALVLDSHLLWGGADGVMAWLRDCSASAIPVVLLMDASNDLPLARVNKVLRKPFYLHELLDVIRALAVTAAPPPCLMCS